MIPKINNDTEKDTGTDIQHLIPVKAIVPQPVSLPVIEQIDVQYIPEEPSNPS
jgi:hypothetical protein